MLSNSPEFGGRNRVPVEKQRVNLLVLQTAQTIALEASGAAEIGRQVLLERSASAEPEPEPIPASTRVIPAMDRGKLYMRYISVEKVGEKLANVMRSVVVGEVNGDNVIPADGFDEGHVTTATQQLHIIERAIEQGQFPDIADDRSSILDSAGDTAFS